MPVAPDARVSCPVPLYFLRYRYPHHAAASGYDRLCDYVGETVQLPNRLYWMGETVLRLPALWVSKFGGHYEYSRYDYVMESAAIRHFLEHRDSVYHIIYAEKSYKRLRRYAGRNGNKLVGTIHHPPEHNDWLFRSVDHFKALDFATVVSKQQLPYWESLMGASRVAYVPHGVDTTYFAPSAEGPAQPPYCLFVGHHERDFDQLPELADRILSAHAQARFIMLSLDGRCEAIARRHDRAVWHEWVSDAEFLSLLRGATLLVLPLKRSTTCTAVLDAMACGVPVVTTEGGIEDYVNPNCSTVLPTGDTEGMARAIHRVLSDPQERARMSDAARRRACEFSWTRTAELMVDIYTRLSAGKTS